MLGVDLLEAVDVDEDERERALVALCAPSLGAQLLVEGAVVGKVRELVARRERSQLGARVGERDRRLGASASCEQPARHRRRRRRARPRAGRRCGSVRSRERPCRCGRPCGGLVPFERDRGAGHEADGAARLAGADDRAEATRLEADDGGGVDAEVDRRLLGDDGEQLDRVGLERDRILNSLLGGAGRQGSRAAEDGDDAGDEPELVAAGEPAALEHDVGAVLVRVALRAVRGREQVVRVQERVDLDADELRRPCSRAAARLRPRTT